MNQTNTLFGITIVPSPYAIEYRVSFTVERCGHMGKRRKRWRVLRNEQRRPACYRLADGTLVIHPDLIPRMQSADLFATFIQRNTQ